jgi:hypothetical protein
MARVFFVMGSNGGMGKSVPPTSDDLYSVFLADLSEAVPNKNNITVQGILEKSWLADAVQAELATADLQASCKNIT